MKHNEIERELCIGPILDYNRIQDRRVFIRKKNAFTLIELLAVIIIIVVIVLISAIDVIYASNNNNCNSSTDLNAIGNACLNSNWLIEGRVRYWTLTRYLGTTGQPTKVICRQTDGNLSGCPVKWDTIGAYPAMYLNFSVKITGGTGTSGDPYILGTW